MKSFEQYCREIHPELEENWKTNLALLGGGALGLLGAGKFAHDHMKKAQAEPTALTAKADPGTAGSLSTTSPSRPITRPAEGTPTDAPPARPPGVSGAEPTEPTAPEPERMVPKEPEKEIEVVYGDGKLPYEKPKYWSADMDNVYQNAGKELMRRGAKGVRIQQVYGETEDVARKGAYHRAALDVGSQDLDAYGAKLLMFTPLKDGRAVYTVIYSSNPLYKAK